MSVNSFVTESLFHISVCKIDRRVQKGYYTGLYLDINSAITSTRVVSRASGRLTVVFIIVNIAGIALRTRVNLIESIVTVPSSWRSRSLRSILPVTFIDLYLGLGRLI